MVNRSTAVSGAATGLTATRSPFQAIERSHLTSRLWGDGRPSFPLVTVSAPPGYGKTSLVHQVREHIIPKAAGEVATLYRLKRTSGSRQPGRRT